MKILKRFSHSLKSIVFATMITWGFAAPAMASMHFTLSGSKSISHAAYETIESGGLSGSVAWDLGEYIRIGYTYRQELQSTKGYTLETTDNAYHKFESSSRITSQSADLTLVLYAGDIFTPYIFAGGGPKTYDTYMNEEGKSPTHNKSGLTSPNGGVGLSIRISQNFSLKMSYTISQGITVTPDTKPSLAIDSYTQAGISYAF